MANFLGTRVNIRSLCDYKCRFRSTGVVGANFILHSTISPGVLRRVESFHLSHGEFLLNTVAVTNYIAFPLIIACFLPFSGLNRFGILLIDVVPIYLSVKSVLALWDAKEEELSFIQKIQKSWILFIGGSKNPRFD